MIQSISSAAQSTAAVEGVKAPVRVQRAEDEVQSRFQKPVMDEYIPGEKQEPSGRYWLERGEDGQPKVCFDDLERAADAPEKQDGRPSADSSAQDKAAGGPTKSAPGKKAETCTGNTDKVDREIENLKKRQEELERQMHSETDEAKIKALERELSRVERELSQKDNDAYRRQHTVFS